MKELLKKAQALYTLGTTCQSALIDTIGIVNGVLRNDSDTIWVSVKTEFNNSDSIYIYYDNKWGKILDPVSQVEVNEIINNYKIY